ncbi:hypothetical protein [Mycolicibacterium hodleri]|uniref:hypothetical protein n=1 Tax=Mycolicibacterium hodleri TaxID=49897 RepID=UPI00112CC2E7|nr:hypothetical protein [Mycolicibacterium hodleri]
MPIADAEHASGPHRPPLVRAALMHLLWLHEYSVNLDESLPPVNDLGGAELNRAGVRVGMGTRFAYDGEIVVQS